MRKTFTLVYIIFTTFVFAQVPGAVPTNGLIAYWPFNGNANDVSGNAKNGTVTGATLTNDRFGNANSAYNFSGAAQFITCPSISELNGSNSASFSLWVKINGNNSWTNCNLGCAQYLLSRDGDFSSTNIGIGYGPGNKLFGGRIGSNGSGTGVGSTNTYNIPQSTWHHIVFTIGGGFLKLYVDGVFNSSSVFTGVMPSSSGNLFFGKLPVGGYEYYLNGFLDDIGIWNRALTATEITNLYNNTSVSIATPPVAASTQTFCGSATVADLAATGTNLKWYDVATGGASLASSAILVTGTYYVSQTTGTNESTRTTVAVSINDPQITASATTVCSGTAVILTASTTLSGTGTSVLPSNLQTGLVGYWPFNGNANDTSGNGNNGTVNGATLTTDRFGNANSAYFFNGNYITIPHSNSFDFNDFSVSTWISTSQSTVGAVIKQLNYSNAANERFSIGVNNPLSTAHFAVKYNNSSCIAGVGWQYNSSTQFLFNNQYHHLVGTVSGNTTKLYIDGVLVNTLVLPYDQSSICFGGDIQIGRDWSSFFHYFLGNIDDIAIYNRTLSPEEISQLFNYTQTLYSWSTGETTATINPTPTTTTTYWCDVTTNGVTCRKEITITVTPTVTPTAVAQTFCKSATVANLFATGTAIKWYAASTGGTALANTTALITGTTYYASQTVGTCESTRTAAAVSINDPQITASATTVCSGTTVNLTASTSLSGSVTSVLPNNLQSGLMAFYPFNGNANDTSINGNNPTINTIQYTSDRNGNANSAGLFLGAQYAIVPNSSSLNVSGDFSVASWVYLNNDFPSTGWWNTKAIFTKNNDYPYGAKVFITPDEDSLWISFGTSMWDANQGFGKRILRSELLGAWHHFTWTYDNNVGKLFLDGTLILSQSATPNWSNANTLDLHIAVNGDPAGNYPYKFVGKMDDLGLWSRSLSSSEITELSSVQSYLWSTGETTAAINPSPTATTTYWCDVTTNGVTCRKEITITVNPNVIPTFTQVAAVCSGTTITALPTTSTNAVTGTWSPTLNNTTTTTYTFTPTAGQCANTTTQTITITDPKVTSPISFEAPVVALSSVTIGTQIWTNKNLDVSTYRDGTPIPQVTDPTAWANLTTGAWCYYNNDPSNNSVYGKLYNWYAVNDPRGLAPAGYHVPSDAEWTTLTNFLGGDAVAGGKMKTTGTLQEGTGLWLEPNSAATNESGFSGLPVGYRYHANGLFDIFGTVGWWWSSSESNSTDSLLLALIDVNSTAFRDDRNKRSGFSVRCLKD